MRRRLDDLGLGRVLGITLRPDTSHLLLGHNRRFSRITIGNAASQTSWRAGRRLGDGCAEWRSSVA